MSYNILIPFYHTFIAVIGNVQNHLIKLIECIVNNNFSILLIIKLYTFIICAACTDASHVLETTDGVSTCVCAVGYYQTALGDADNPPTCTSCPYGTTTTATDSQDIHACGKNWRIIIPMDWF